MNQLEMFNGTPPTGANNTAVTSRAAGVAMMPHVGTLRRKILGLLVAKGKLGGTDGEIQEELGLKGSTERPRRKELEKGGFVEDSGQVRQTASGRAAVVWRATAKATLGAPEKPVFPET